MSKKFLKMMNEMYDTFWIYFWVVIFLNFFFFALKTTLPCGLVVVISHQVMNPSFLHFLRRRSGEEKEREEQFFCV